MENEEPAVKSMFIISFETKGIVHKEFVLAGQAANSAYCCDILLRMPENVRRLRSELWRRKNWPLDHDKASSHTSFFSREFFTRTNMTVIPTHLTFLCSPG
jgi:hypothetical protein